MQTVTAAIIQKEDYVLIARRGPNSKLAGQWEFPGGKVEEGESLRECLARELKEELGIDSTIGDHLMHSEYVYEHGGFTIEAFLATWTAGELALNVHDKIEWVALRDLEGYQLLPADVPIARKLFSDRTMGR